MYGVQLSNEIETNQTKLKQVKPIKDYGLTTLLTTVILTVT
jgi:hypothetical protein